VYLTVGGPGISGDENIQEMVGQRLVARLGETTRASPVSHFATFHFIGIRTVIWPASACGVAAPAPK
jgi:hypothetical protein